MLFSEASGRKVVSTATAETVGRVHDYVIDPSGPKVAALLLKKGEGDTLRWSDILAFGTDAVTVESAEKITKGGDDLSALLEKRNHLHKKRVLLTTGNEIGSVRDIDFDPATGAVTAFVLDDKERSEVPGARLVGVGSYAVVVEAETAASNPLPPARATDAEPARPAADLSRAERASYPPAD